MAEKVNQKNKERTKLMLLIGLSLVGGVILLTQTLPVLLPKKGGTAVSSKQTTPLPERNEEKVVIPEGPKTSTPLPPYKERDPFQYGDTAAENAAPLAGTVTPAEPKVAEQQLILEDIYDDDGKFIASINGEEYKVGDSVSDWVIDSISISQVTIRKGKTKKILKMEE